jgi:hypothetical protein
MKFICTGKSLVELLETYGKGNGGFCSSWWKNENFAKDKPEAGEYEIDFKNVYLGLSLDEQKKKIKKGFEIAHPVVIAEAILSHYEKTGKRLAENFWLRSSLFTDAGHVSCVGYFDGNGLVVNYWDGLRNSDVGVGASRKFKSLKSGASPKRVFREI